MARPNTVPAKISEMTAELGYIQKLADRPIEEGGMTAEQLKAAFDKGSLDIQAFLNDVVVNAINTYILPYIHRHGNEALLDSLAAANVHTHANKALLDSIAAANVHTHGNKALLDSYNQSNAVIADAVAKRHRHGNQAVLDGITAAKLNSIHSHGNMQILNALGTNPAAALDALGAAPAMKLLWTNPAPTAAFPDGTLTISGLKDYNLFAVGCRINSSAEGEDPYESSTTYHMAYAPTMNKTRVHLTDAMAKKVSASGVVVRDRYVDITRSAGTVHFTTGYMAGWDYSTSGYIMIPQYIIGMNVT